jgi:hypothetical protein
MQIPLHLEHKRSIGRGTYHFRKLKHPSLLAHCLALIVALVLAGGAGEVLAQSLTSSALDQITAILAEKNTRTPVQDKIDSQLLYASRAHRGIQPVPGVPGTFSAVAADNTGRVVVDIKAQVTDLVLAQIRSAGGTIINSFPALDAIRAVIPIDRVEDLAAIPEVRFIQPQEQFETRKVISQGDITHRANIARSRLGVNGSGIAVGVLSDTVNQLRTLQASGNLPANCPAGPPCVKVLPGQSGAGLGPNSEGTAMMEIVNSLAPGSNLIFATALNGEASFATNILKLQAAGARVLVDDIGYFAEPVFEDGIIAKAINDVVAKGVIYFSAAGNDGNKANGTSGTWEGDYSGTVLPGALARMGISALNFGGGRNFNTITATPSSGNINLKWSDRLGASTNDYDLFLLDPSGGFVILQSTNRQNGTQDPLEQIAWDPMLFSAEKF